MTDSTLLPLLRIQALSIQPPAGPALVDWSADVGPGLSLITDEEGEVKTSLLRVLAGEQAPAAGTVRWRGRDVAAWAAEPGVAEVFWRDPRAPWPEISPLQWVAQLRARHPNWSDGDWQAHAHGLGLDEHLHKEMFRLSTGSQRKVVLAAALASGAPLTLIDEPEAALDWASIRCLREALTAEAQRSRVTGRVWVVAHYEPIPDVAWAQVLPLG